MSSVINTCCLREHIQATNARYAAADKMGKRIMEARDALFMLLPADFTARRNTYVRYEEEDAMGIGFHYGEGGLRREPVLEDFLSRNKMPACQVCAKGAISLVSLLRNRTQEQLKAIRLGSEAWGELYDDTRNAGGSAWDAATLDAMEMAFECWKPDSQDFVDREFHEDSPWAVFESDHDRLCAIYANIIRHDGAFDYDDQRPFTPDVMVKA